MACLEPYLIEYCPNIHDAAALMGISVRSLQRALGAEGLTYRRLVNNLRCRKALIALRCADTSLTELALDLGYSDETAFSRAFRRWAGVSPSAYLSDAAEQPAAS
jgi:AraC-like DNA-binding protein